MLHGINIVIRIVNSLNDLPLVRSVDETLRMVDALQYFEENGEVCPADWNKGKDGLKDTAEGIASYLSTH